VKRVMRVVKCWVDFIIMRRERIFINIIFYDIIFYYFSSVRSRISSWTNLIVSFFIFLIKILFSFFKVVFKASFNVKLSETWILLFHDNLLLDDYAYRCCYRFCVMLQRLFFMRYTDHLSKRLLFQNAA